jgi:hypothetical protein
MQAHAPASFNGAKTRTDKIHGIARIGISLTILTNANSA